MSLCKKSSVILSEGEGEMCLAEESRRAGVEGPRLPERGRISFHKVLPRQDGRLALPEATRIRFGHPR